MLDFILEQHERTGEPLPEKIANAPKLVPGLELYMEAFSSLGSCRGMNGTIPWTAIEEYCRVYGISGIQKEDLHSHLKAMDAVCSKYWEKKRGK